MPDTETTAEVIVERRDDGIAVVRINRPRARNALSVDVRALLIDAFDDLARDDAVRVAILTGGDKVFVAGADIRVMAPMNAIDMANSGLERVYEALKAFSKPLIAAVNGVALGGGCELAMIADIIIAGETASFAQSEVQVGIMAGAGGTQRLVRAVGKFKAMRMLLTGMRIPAIEAESMGLVSEIAPDAEVMDRAIAMAQIIARLPPLAIRQTKRMVLEGADLPIDAALRMERQAFTLLFDTEDKREGMNAFLEKRPAHFLGR